MGGFRVSIKDIYPTPATQEEEAVPETPSLSPYGIMQLAEAGHFVTISGTKLEDTSKSSIVQKALVLIQVGWMAVQCIFRGAVGLPVSLLEIHTLVHVACAVIMYAFWIRVHLSKPTT